jgi:predicted lactoylglutathione lyase
VEQRVSVITLGVADLARTKSFYVEGLGWTPAFEDHEIVFFQLNGIALGCFLQSSMIAEAHLPEATRGTGFIAISHNVRTREEVDPLMQLAAAHGGTIIAPAVDRSAFGGYSGYVTDPDGHPWEICWNPKSPIDEDGNLLFGG